MKKEFEGLTPEQVKEVKAWKRSYGPLGKEICTAYIAYRLMVTFPTAAKRYAPNEPGSYWIALSELVFLTVEDPEFQTHTMDFIKVLRTLRAERGN